MTRLKKIAGYNILAILIYSIVIRLTSPTKDGSMAILIYSAMAISAHVCVCILVALGCWIANTREYARAWLAGAGIVLLVGFSVCLGNTAL